MPYVSSLAGTTTGIRREPLTATCLYTNSLSNENELADALTLANHWDSLAICELLALPHMLDAPAVDSSVTGGT